MISAEFRKENGKFRSFAVSGHAMFADYGGDIVCASVTSALQLTANGVTEVLGIPAQVQVEENEISLTLPADAKEEAQLFLAAFHLQLKLLEEDFPNNIKLIVSEV